MINSVSVDQQTSIFIPLYTLYMISLILENRSGRSDLLPFLLQALIRHLTIVLMWTYPHKQIIDILKHPFFFFFFFSDLE